MRLQCEVETCSFNEGGECQNDIGVELGYHPGLPGIIDNKPAMVCYSYNDDIRCPDCKDDEEED